VKQSWRAWVMSADSATLALGHGEETEQAIHGALREAVRDGLGYARRTKQISARPDQKGPPLSLIRESTVAGETHLRIGRRV